FHNPPLSLFTTVRCLISTDHGDFTPKELDLPTNQARRLLLATALLTTLHDGARRDLFGAFAVASGFLRGFFNMLVLPLLFRAGAANVSFDCHKLNISRWLPLFRGHGGVRPAGAFEQTAKKPAKALVDSPGGQGLERQGHHAALR